MPRRRLPHYVERWTHWTDEAERLEALYELEEAAHLEAFRKGHPDAAPSAAQIDWEQSRRSRTLVSKGEWAHRKAQTFGIAVLVARAVAEERRRSIVRSETELYDSTDRHGD